MINKKIKLRLNRQNNKLPANKKLFTSSGLIVNLPRTANVTEIRGLFPHAVDIQIKRRKWKAVDTTFVLDSQIQRINAV